MERRTIREELIISAEISDCAESNLEILTSYTYTTYKNFICL
jgi:hypothetical protein